MVENTAKMEKTIEKLEWCIRTLENLNHSLKNGFIKACIETLKSVDDDLKKIK